MKTWFVLLLFLQIGLSIRFEFYQLEKLIAFADNGTDLAGHVNETQNNGENVNDDSSQREEKKEEEKILKIMTRIKREARFSINRQIVKQELDMGIIIITIALLFDIIVFQGKFSCIKNCPCFELKSNILYRLVSHFYHGYYD